MQQLQAGNFRGSPAALSNSSRTCAGLWSELRQPPYPGTWVPSQNTQGR
jgi:hypothetical protein